MKKKQNGLALIMVMLIGAIALVAVVSATTVVISELKKSSVTTFGVSQYQITYGVLENAFIQLLRNPNYSSETVTIGLSTCEITATSGFTKTVAVSCSDGKYVRKIGATVTFIDGIMTVSGISELP